MIFMAGGNAFSLVHEYKSGWNPEAFRERYSEVLERFDYIVGDWGYNQLRLRGFYRDGHPRATKESAISSFIDYINEYCNFGCAHFVLSKMDSNALPPGVEISKEESPEAIVALNETGEQVAETAAALSGPIMRWPLKERAGGPVRAPNITVSAVARAAADAERRNAGGNANPNSNAAGSSSQSRGGQSRQGNDNRQGRSSNGSAYGGERRPQQQAQGGGQTSNKPPYPPRGPRPQGGEQAKRSTEENRNPESGNASFNNEGSRGEGARNDNRWQGKNRRRKSFGGKPNQRPNGAAPRPEAGSPRSGE
ncbi:YutD family protein [Cohnella mopanensis]|uniref:YutD family protein n=1 Tax=Cohnella mopanensis TaxID=2911966 RepID=UPI001EF88A1C|nr:YutD family protein [Cohnella mopanensis]